MDELKIRKLSEDLDERAPDNLDFYLTVASRHSFKSLVLKGIKFILLLFISQKMLVTLKHSRVGSLFKGMIR